MDVNRILISSVQIKNFRSIRNETLKVNNFNIFVGLNDAGKSNFLKALNLFFNNQTDYNTPFDFSTDFSFLFPKKGHNTREIKIIIKFIVPEGYKGSGLITWEKTWRTDNYFKERIVDEKGEAPSLRSRIPGALNRIKFRYVPAVKSKDYYKSLLTDLYLTVSASLTSPLKNSINDFSNVLKEYTKHISESTLSHLNINSELSIPDNLSDIFRALIFKTSTTSDSICINLDYRGDGIQARHIPIILKYIADEDQNSRTQGSTKIYTIWGFEEPENGVELTKAFELADEFDEYSSTIQLFVSTHSPAFYMKNSTPETSVFFTTKKESNDETSFISNRSAELIGKDMGLMPLVAPFIAKKMEELNQIKSITSESLSNDIDTILVEGVTDKDYLTMAINRYSPSLSELLASKQLRIFTKEGQGGTSQISDWAKSWIYSGNTSKFYILFDKDIAGIKAHDSLNEELKELHKKGPMKIQYWEPSEDIINFYRNDIRLYYEVEHLLSFEFWQQLKEKNYAEPRIISDLLYSFEKHFKSSMSLDETIETLIKEKELTNPILTMNPNDNKKDQIRNLAKTISISDPNTTIFSGFESTIIALEKYFKVQ